MAADGEEREMVVVVAKVEMMMMVVVTAVVVKDGHEKSGHIGFIKRPLLFFSVYLAWRVRDI